MPILRRFYICCYFLLLVSSLNAGTYQVRYWKSNAWGYGYGCAYKSSDEYLNNLEAAGFTLHTPTGNGSYYADTECCCHLWDGLYPYHFRIPDRGYAINIWCNQDAGFWITDMKGPTTGGTSLSAASGAGYKCTPCVSGGSSGYETWGQIFNVYVTVVDDSNVPYWMWTSPNYKNFTPIFDESGNIIGGTGKIDTSKAPTGAIQSGDYQNGDWAITDDGPEWQWYPGMEPQLTAEETQANYDSILSAIDSLGGDIADSLSPYLLDLQASLSGIGSPNITVESPTLNVAAPEVNVTVLPAPVEIDLSGVIGAVNSASSANLSAHASTLSAVNSFASSSLAAQSSLLSAQSSFFSSNLSALDSVNSSLSAVSSKLDSLSTDLKSVSDFVNSDFSAETDGGFTVPASDNLDLPEDMGVEFANSTVSTVQGVTGAWGTYFNGLVGSLIGSWTSLARTPWVISLDLDLPVIGRWQWSYDLSNLEPYISLLRAVEGLALWLALVWNVLKLLSHAFSK